MFAQIQPALHAQEKRFGKTGFYNARMSADQVEKFCVLTQDAEQLLKKAFEKLNLSMRGYHKILKVARTLADLYKQEKIHHNTTTCLVRCQSQNFN